MVNKSGWFQNREVQEKVNQVRDLIENHFPGLWTPVDLGLSTCATLLLKDNVNPVAVIYVGPPSSSKSTVAEMFADAKVNGETFCYVSDDFTPAAWVSQAANVPTEKLDRVDLLLRIKHKVLVTPELAPIFRGKEDELTRTFRILTRVLDGEGLMRDGGVHGRRGHRGGEGWPGAVYGVVNQIFYSAKGFLSMVLSIDFIFGFFGRINAFGNYTKREALTLVEVIAFEVLQPNRNVLYW